MVLDVAELLLLKHRAAKAKGITINVTSSSQPPLRQILTSQPSPHRHNQDSPPKSEFLSEVGVRSGTAPATHQLLYEFGFGVIVILDMLEYCSEVVCAFSHQHY